MSETTKDAAPKKLGDTRPNHAEQRARSKLPCLPEAWRVVKWRVLGKSGDAVEFTFQESRMKTLKSGPNRGKERREWFGPERSAIVTDSEERAEFARYERETGNCGVCGDTGQEWMGWSRVNGDRYRPCVRCTATGKAPAK